MAELFGYFLNGIGHQHPERRRYEKIGRIKLGEFYRQVFRFPAAQSRNDETRNHDPRKQQQTRFLVEPVGGVVKVGFILIVELRPIGWCVPVDDVLAPADLLPRDIKTAERGENKSAA